MKNKGKTIREWFEEARKNGAEWADKAIFYSSDQVLSDSDNSLSGAISGGFVWEETEEGHEYWRNIRDSLLNKQV